MKKIFLLFTVLLLFPLVGNAAYVTIDGIYYSVRIWNGEKEAIVQQNTELSFSGAIVIPATVEYDGTTYPVTSIGTSAFENYTNITAVTLPNSVLSIGPHAFAGCTNLKSINIPNKIKIIHSAAFSGCINLTIPITLPETLETFDDAVFYQSGITSLTTSVKWIRTKDFAECPNLKQVILKEGVERIDEKAFYRCLKLETIVLSRTIATLGKNAFWEPDQDEEYVEYVNRHVYFLMPDSTDIDSDYWYKVYKLVKADNPVWSKSNTVHGYIHVTGTNLQNYMQKYWTAAYRIMEQHHLTYYIDGKEYKSYEHYCWEHITPEAYPQKEYATFSGWSEIPEYMPDNDYNVYGHFTIDEGYDNKIVVNNVDVFSGKTTGLDICLQNDGTDLTAYQFDLSLPAGFDIAKNKKGKPDVKLSDRYEDDNPSLSIEELGNGKYRFVCISMTNGVIEGTEGPLMSMNIQVPSDVTEGSYTGKVENIVMTHADETKQKLAPVSFTFNVSTYIKGDADGDLEIDVADVVSIVNYILERPSENFDAKAADVDEDGEIDVADAVKVVNMILAQVSNSTPRKQLMTVTQAPTGDGLYVEDFSIKEGEKIQISLKLKNAIDYCSFQCDLFLPEGLTIALNKKGKPDVKLDEDRMDDHSLSVEHAANGSYRLVCTSLSNAEFYENDGPIVNIMVEPIADFPSGTQEGRIENTVLVETNGTKHKDFETSTFKVSFGIPTHVDTVKTNGTYDIYNLQGIKVRSNDSSTVLPKGMYIMNGEKFYVK